MLPKFVFRWLKQTSLGGIRSKDTINRRIQDGLKRPWLCLDCEGLFSRWESDFCEQIFRPIHEAPEKREPRRYGSWALPFAVSVSWRMLLLYENEDLSHCSADERRLLRDAEVRWRRFLLGQEDHPGVFEQHMLAVDVLADATGDVSPFLSRYFARTVHADLITSKHSCMTYAKLGRLAIFGFVRQERGHEWRGTKVHVKKGHVGGSVNLHLPGFLAHYWNDKANAQAAAMASMSHGQQKLVEEVFKKTPLEKLGASESFRAMRADVELTGDAAFEVTRSKGHREAEEEES